MSTLDEARERRVHHEQVELSSAIRAAGVGPIMAATIAVDVAALARAVFREEIAREQRAAALSELAEMDADLVVGPEPTPPAEGTGEASVGTVETRAGQPPPYFTSTPDAGTALTDGEADAGAKALAEWFRYSWDGLSDRDISDRFSDFTELPKFQGGKPALRKMAARISKPFVDRIAGLERRLAEARSVGEEWERAGAGWRKRVEDAERERDEARSSLADSEADNVRLVKERADMFERAHAAESSLETAERRIGKLEAFAKSFRISVNEASFYKDVTLHLVEPHALSTRLANCKSDKAWIYEDLEARRIAALTPDAGTARSDGEGV